MPRDRAHLELPKLENPLRRRKQASRRNPQPDRPEHGRRLAEEATQLATRLQRRTQSAPQGINPKLVFKLQLHLKGNLSEDDLRQMGLRVLARHRSRAVVVFPDDATLTELRRR